MPESTTPATATGAPGWPLLDVRSLTKEFEQRAGPFGSRRRLVRALDRVSFTIARGETLGLVGESGSGKTTAGRCALRLVEPTAGTVLLHPREDAATGAAAPPSDFTAARGGALLALRRRTAMVFQDPQSFLSPRMTVGEIVAEPLLLAGERRGAALQEKVATLLSEVGLSAAEMARPPQALSGGQKQRVGFARALALSPELVVADEPVSALDVSVRAQILALTASLKASRRVAWLFIGHDLRVVAHVSDRIAVMYLGRIVEVSPTAELFARPRHPYTESLLAAIPVADPAQRGRPRRALQGDPPSPADPPRGCAFHPRCAYAQEICTREEPPLVRIGGTGEPPGAPSNASEAREAACHFARELTLTGAER